MGAACRQAAAGERLRREILDALLHRGRFLRGNVGLSDFSDAAVRDPAVVALASKCATGLIRRIPTQQLQPATISATLADGRIIEERQPHMRGGAHEPLARADIEAKFALKRQARRVGRRAHERCARIAAHAV